MNKILKTNVEKCYIMLLGIVTLFILGTYYSYALFTVRAEEKETIKIITGSLYSKLSDNNSNGIATMASIVVPSSKTSFSIQPNEEKTIELKIDNINNRTAKFNLYYQASTLEKVKIGYLENSPVPSKEGFILEANEQKVFKIRIYNQGTENVRISFGSGVGLADKPLDFPKDAEVIEAYQVEDGPAVKELLSKANKTSQYDETTEKELYPLKMTITNQDQEDTITDYRYIGNQPNNYALFQDEQYRIVGVFETKDEYGILEKRIKLVKETPFKTSLYHQEEKNLYEESLVKKSLEEEFYNQLEEESKNLISQVEWYLGDLKDASLKNIYQEERNRRDISPYLYHVALLYPSDYLYSYALNYNQSCFMKNTDCGNGWLGTMLQDTSSFLLSYNSKEESPLTTAAVDSSKELNFQSSLQEEKTVYPSFYLKSNVKVTGDGSKENPYQFSIK